MDKRKILLVEDSLLPQRIVQTILENLECQVDIAETGEEGVTLCLKNHYDLVLMDIGLPGIDGIQATQRIRQKENVQHHLPIIALTAHNESETKARALDAGMDDYLVKPLSASIAQEILSRYCAQAHSSGRLSRRKNH